MSRIFLLFAIVLSMSLEALPVGNPSPDAVLYGECGVWSLSLGYYGDFVFDRHLKVAAKSTPHTIHRTEIATQAAIVEVGYCNLFSLFATAGSSKFWISDTFKQHPFFSPGIGGDGQVAGLISAETDGANLSWSVGGRGTIWECGPFAFGCEGQYFYAPGHLNDIESYLVEPLDSSKFYYHEWQLGIGVSYLVCIAERSYLIPYAAFKYSQVRMKLSGNAQFYGVSPFGFRLENLHSLKNEFDVGYALGLTLVGFDRLKVTVEGRFADELAVHVDASMRF